MIKLGVLELKALSALVEEGASVGGLAERLGASAGLASRAVSGLLDKGFVVVSREGVRKLVSLSDAGHARAFKRLMQSRPNAGVEEWLSGSALDVLVVASGSEGAARWIMESECACSAATVAKIVGRLRAAGVAVKTGEGGLVITDELVKGFANAYADWLQFRGQEGLHGYNVSVRVRKHVILRSQARQVPDFFVVTGMTALINAGLDMVPTSYADYYYSIDGRKRVLQLEEQFAHALVLASLTRHAGDRAGLALFIATRRNLNNRLVGEAAKRFLVTGLYYELRRINELKEMTYGSGRQLKENEQANIA